MFRANRSLCRILALLPPATALSPARGVSALSAHGGSSAPRLLWASRLPHRLAFACHMTSAATDSAPALEPAAKRLRRDAPGGAAARGGRRRAPTMAVMVAFCALHTNAAAWRRPAGDRAGDGTQRGRSRRPPASGAAADRVAAPPPLPRPLARCRSC